MKAGHKTTEFYTAMVAAIIPVINSSFGLNIPVEGVVSVVAICATYIISRTVVKSKESGSTQ